MIHTYTLNGYNFAIDGNSGSVHLLDELSYKILENQELYDEGILFSTNEMLASAVVKRNRYDDSKKVNRWKSMKKS